MERMFLVKASNRERVESRILQILDHHMVPVQSFSSTRIGDETRVTFMAVADEACARRTCDLLRRVHHVQSVDTFAYQEGFCRTIALFRVLCDQESRLPLLQVISSVGAQVVAVRPEWIAFQVIGNLEDIEGLRASLMPYGVVEAISAASTAVRSETSPKAGAEIAPAISAEAEMRRVPASHQPVPAYGVSV